MKRRGLVGFMSAGLLALSMLPGSVVPGGVPAASAGAVQCTKGYEIGGVMCLGIVGGGHEIYSLSANRSKPFVYGGGAICNWRVEYEATDRDGGVTFWGADRRPGKGCNWGQTYSHVNYIERDGEPMELHESTVLLCATWYEDGNDGGIKACAHIKPDRRPW